jgi:hypothetical protein
MAVLALVASGCSGPPAPGAAAPSVPPSPLTHVSLVAPTTRSTPALKTKPAPLRAATQTPEQECDEVVKKLKDAGFWEKRVGEPGIVGSVWVGDHGVLEVGMCDITDETLREMQSSMETAPNLCRYSERDMHECLDQIEKIWISVHSPDAPSRSRLVCTALDLKRENPITVRVDSRGFSKRQAQALISGCRK